MKIFKNQFAICASIIAGLLLLSTCKEDKEPKLSVTPSNLTFKANETEEKVLTVDTNAKSWGQKVSYQGESGWINVYEKTGHEKQLFVKVNENANTESSRTGTITFSAGKTTTVDVTVEQEKKPVTKLSVTPTEVKYGAAETGNKTIEVSTDAPSWDFVNPNVDWMQLTKQVNQLIVNVATVNPSTSEDRVATIIFKSGNAPELPLKVTQSPRNSLSVSSSQLTYTPAGSTQTVTVTTNAPSWSATSSNTSWLTLEVNNNVLSVIAAKNTTTSNRTATITFKAGTATDVSVSVTQSFYTLTISPTSRNFTYNQTTSQSTAITTNAPSWAATTTASWVTLNQSGSTLNVSVSQNTGTASRTATVNFSADGVSIPSTTLTVTQEAPPQDYISVSPTSYTFAYNATSQQTATVESNPTTWSFEKPAAATWLTVSQNGNSLRYNPTSQNTTGSVRSTTITLRAGTASTTFTVTQATSTPPPTYPGRCNYTATGSPIWDLSGYMYTSWTGELIPNTTSSTPTYYTLTNWTNKSVSIRFNYVGGQFQVDRTTRLLYDPTGYGGYLCWGTINFSALQIIYYPDDDRTISYNSSTRTFDPGTYNGLPVFLGIIVKNENTGKWDLDSWFINDYYDIKIVHTATTSAPQIRSNEVENSIVKKRTLSDFQKTIVEK